MKRLAIINNDTSEQIRKNLRKHDIEPIPIPPSELLAAPIAGHPDMQVFPMREKIFCHPLISPLFIKKIERHMEVIIGDTVLQPFYPHDIAYNIALVGEYALHKWSHSDSIIKEHLSTQNIKAIKVSQGYSKCSTAIVDDNHIITADKKIHAATVREGIESLLITAGYISLPGYSYGFIGGATGSYDRRVLFSGTIDHHPQRTAILQFIEKASCHAIFLSKEKIIDLGSIFIIDAE